VGPALLHNTLLSLTASRFSVFVHRYRDSDPIIRADCVAALGVWSVRYSSYFLEGSNLRYLGWVLSDKATVVRHEAVKSIHGLYSKKDYIVSLHPFTERFKPRLIEIATKDIDLPTRVAVIQLLRTIDDQGLLEDEQREQLCLLVFGTEVRIRRAVGAFANSVWTEAVEGKLMGRRDLEKETPRAQAKALAELLVKWSKMVDEESKQITEETQNQTQDDPAKEHTKLVLDDPTLAIARRDRISLAVESLWDDIDIIRDWQSLLQLLLLDHSTEREAAVTHPKKRKAGKAKATDGTTDDAWRLEEHEEAVLLQVLLGALKRAFEDSKTKKKVTPFYLLTGFLG
jgi:cohesin complex subunit SA-1/2